MALIQGKSKKAFESNMKAEMSAGKPQDQSLAIAYSVQRKNRKKMAQGGMVNNSAKSESRPMPSERDADSDSISRNSGIRPQPHGSWIDDITVRQAQSPSPARATPPTQLGTDTYSRRYQSEQERDLHRMSSEAPDGGGSQPRESYDEELPQRKGPNPQRRFAYGGMALGGEMPEHPSSIADAIMRKKRMYAEGGQVDLQSNENEEQPNDYDDQNEGDISIYDEPILKEHYDESGSMTDRIRARMKKRGA